MKKISNWYNKIHKILQLKTEGMYDTFGTFRKDKKGKRLEHKRGRRYSQQEKFYEGFDEFLESMKEVDSNDTNNK